MINVVIYVEISLVTSVYWSKHTYTKSVSAFFEE